MLLLSPFLLRLNGPFPAPTAQTWHHSMRGCCTWSLSVSRLSKPTTHVAACADNPNSSRWPSSTRVRPASAAGRVGCAPISIVLSNTLIHTHVCLPTWGSTRPTSAAGSELSNWQLWVLCQLGSTFSRPFRLLSPTLSNQKKS